jgi:tRNA(adenine34) deaminase
MKPDQYFMEKAVELALLAEQEGNLPIGAIIVLDGEIIAQGCNTVLIPNYHPGRHAETEALKQVPLHYWPQAGKMTCYTTLEPCTMCFGALLLHGIGRVVFGASDKQGGALVLMPHLPPYYTHKNRVFEWVGPIMPEVCDPLYERAVMKFGNRKAN